MSNQANHQDNEQMDLIVTQVESTTELDRLKHKWLSLKESGSMVLVIDWELAYEIKPRFDAACGGHLRNEIIWIVRGREDSPGGRERHSTLLWYVKNPGLAPFALLTMPRSKETIRRFGDGRIVSTVSPRTGRRAPTRVEGASLAAPLNDVWVWDEVRSSWVYELDEMNTRSSASSAPQWPPLEEPKERQTAEAALIERLLHLTECESGERCVEAPEESWEPS